VESGLVIGGALLALGLLLSWRVPALPLALGLICVAVRPEVLLGGDLPQLDWGLARDLLVVGLAANAIRYGLRRQANWPIAALFAVLVLSAALGNLHAKLTPLLMIEGFAVLALPWAFTNVVLAPGSRRGYAALIAVLPLLSALFGILAGFAQPTPSWGFEGSFDAVYRFAGATGKPEAFGLLAFAGFAVALQEATRPGRPYAGPLAVINLVLIILSGTRMTVVAAVVLLAVHASLSPALRDLFVKRRWFTGGAAAALVATLALYGPALYLRLFQADNGEVHWSARDDLWGFYLEEFMLSPLFGRGLGVGYVAGADWLPNLSRTTPHNEYLHLLVSGGIVGFVLCMAAIGLWYRQLWQNVSDNDRVFLLALAPALGLQAFTADVLVYWSMLGLFAYLGVLLTRGQVTVPMPRPPLERLEQPAAPPPEARPLPRRAALFRPGP
jgi:O-antigen ligase